MSEVPPGPPDDRPGFFQSMAQGGLAAASEGRRMAAGNTFTDEQLAPEIERSFLGRVGYGIGHSSPALAGGFLGAAGGTAVGGPVGGVLGGGLGFGLTSAVQELIPAYDQARRLGLEHDAAVDFAIRSAATSGAIGAATAPLFAWAPFKSELSNLLLHTFATGPGVSTTQTLVQPRPPGQPQPTLEELGQSAVEGAATGAALAGGHALGRELMRPPEIPTVTVTGHRETPPDQAGRAQLGEGAQAAPEPDGSIPKSLPAPEQAPGDQQVAQAEPTYSPEDVRIGRGGEQLPPPIPGLPAPSPALAPPGATPDPTTPTAPVPSPPTAPPDTGAGEGSPLPGSGQGQTGGASPPIPAPPPAVPGSGQGQPTPPGPTPSPPTPTPGETQPQPTQDTTKPEGSPGSTRVVSTARPDVSTPTTYEVVEADTLKQATGDLQPRDRAGRQASEAQIAENAARLDPSQITTSPVADYGAPVVMPDGTVLAGNGRLAAINRAAELHPERYDAYKQALTALGHDVSGMNRPVLVRRTGGLTPEQARQIAEASNAPRAMAMSPVEQAKVDARNLTDETLAKYDPSKQLTSPANRGFIRDWMQTLTPTERNRLQAQDGSLSVEGTRRLQGAVLAKAYDHDPILRRALESPVDDVKSITGSLMDVAAPYVKLKSEIGKGNTPRDLDITKQITEALDLIHQAREKGIAPGDMIKQGDIFGGAKLDPVVEQVVRTFYNDQMTRLRSRPKITEALQDYVDQALAFRPGKDLFGEETKPDPADMLRQAREGKQGGLGIAAESKVEDTRQQTIDTRLDEQRRAGVGATPEQRAQQQQLERLNARVTELEAKGAKITPKEASELASKQKQQAALQRTTGRFVRRKTAQRTRKPVSPHNPKPFYAPRDPLDYTFRDGEISVYRTAFQDAGHNPDLAVNYPLERQIDILTRQTKAQFGLRDVTYDENFDKFQLRGILLDTYRAATDMMATLSYPTDGLGLKGTLALHFEPYVRGIHYSGQWSLNRRGETMIKLVGSGNSLGHEWTHALDYWLAGELPSNPGWAKKLATTMAEEGDLAVPRAGDTISERFIRLLHVLSYDQAALAAEQMQLAAIAQRTDAQGLPTTEALIAQDALNDLTRGVLDKKVQESPFRAKSRAFGAGTRDPDYYPSIEEMLARSGESYLSRRMLDNAVDPRGVVMPDEAYTAENNTVLRQIYPDAQDRVRILQAWDDLHGAIRAELFTGNPSGIFSDPSKIVDLNAISRLQDHGPPPGVIPALRKAARETFEALKTPRASWHSVSFFDKDRPPSPKGSLVKKGHWWVSTKTGLLESIHAYAPEDAKPAVQRILTKIGLQPGTGTKQPITFAERSRHLERDWFRRFINMLDNNRLSPKDLKQANQSTNLMLRHALVTGEDTYKGEPIPLNVAKAAGEIRRLMDEVFKSNRDVGMDIKYARNGYFTRIYDHAKIWHDPDGFKRDAGKLFKKMFDDDVGDDPQALYDRWLKLPKSARTKAGQGIQDAMDELGKNLAAQRRIERNLNDPYWTGDRDKANDRLDELKQAAQDLHDGYADGVGDHVAKLAAENWQHRINAGYPNDFDTVGPSGNYLNKRVLPPEADTILEKWMHNDVVGVLARYFKAAARKQAYNELFGPIVYDDTHTQIDSMGSKLEDDLAEASKNGLHGADIRLIRELVQAETGKASHSAPRLVRQFVQATQAFGATTMLGHATLSMSPEPLVSGIVTGRASAGFRAMYAQLRGFLRKADAKDRAALVDMLNVTVGALQNDAMLHIGSEDYGDTPNVGRFMNLYYDKVSFMTPWDRSSRRASFAALHWALQQSANEYLQRLSYTGDKKGYNWARIDTKGDRAEALFNELGIGLTTLGSNDPNAAPRIDDEFRKRFAEWLVSMDGIPDALAMETSPFLADYDLAMNRLVRRTIQDVARADIPMSLENEWLGMAIQFSRYLYSFNRNVVLPIFSKIHRDTERAWERAREQGYGKFGAGAQAAGAAAMSAGNAAVTVGIYLAGTALAALAAMMLFNPDVLEKEQEKDDFWTGYFLSTVIARSGLTGPLGIPQQALTQIKYRDGLSSLATGPGLANGFTFLTTMAQWLLDDTPATTNARAHNGLAAVWKNGFLPMEVYIATKLAGGFGPLMAGTVGIGNMIFSSRFAAEWFADTVVNVKGTKLPEGGSGEDTLEDQPPEAGGGDGTVTEGDPGSAVGGGEKGPQGLGGLAGSMADDLIAPLSKWGSSIYNATPSVPIIKPAMLGIAAFIFGGWWAWNNYADYRAAPPPPEKP
jgi:ddrB-like ParB superfamily domain